MRSSGHEHLDSVVMVSIPEMLIVACAFICEKSSQEYRLKACQFDPDLGVLCVVVVYYGGQGGIEHALATKSTLILGTAM